MTTTTENTTDTTPKTITEKALLDAITRAKSKDTLIDAIKRATQGLAVSVNVQKKLEKTLLATYKTHDRCEIITNQIMTVVKASPALPQICAAADNLFANKAVRKGNRNTASMAGIKAFVDGRGENEIVEAMAEKCPLLNEKDVAKNELLSLLKRAKDKAFIAEVNIGTQLDKLIEAV